MVRYRWQMVRSFVGRCFMQSAIIGSIDPGITQCNTPVGYVFDFGKDM